MSTTDSRVPLRGLPSIGTFALLTGLTLLFQWTNGGFGTEFESEPDAAAHFVTGLMVRDYFASMAPAPPMGYASNYYLHYPKVALGHWPPFFYVVEAAWMLVFSSSTLSLMLLMAALAAALGTLISEAAKKEFGAGGGLALGVLAVSLPLIQQMSRAVMTDTLVALLTFSATLAFGRYLDNSRPLYSLGFGILASMACLTKGVAFFLAILPPTATVIRRDFRLPARASWWLPAVVVAVACAPWYLFAPGALHGSADLPYGTVAAVRPWDSFKTLGVVTVRNLGWWLVPFIVIGIADKVIRPLWKREQVGGIWAANAALLISLPLFGTVILPARELRQYISVIPPLLLFLAAGAARVLAVMPLRSHWKAAATAIAIALLSAGHVHSVPQAHARGYGEIANRILSDAASADAVILISADSVGEGSMVAELARRETRRPGHIVLRGSKVLASESWTGTSYRLVYSSPEQVVEYLRSIPVAFAVLDSRGGRSPHHALLRTALGEHPGTYLQSGSYQNPSDDAAGRIEVFRMTPAASNPQGRIRIDMTPRLGRIIGN